LFPVYLPQTLVTIPPTSICELHITYITIVASMPVIVEDSRYHIRYIESSSG
jgi:hypothetical protein